MKLISYTLISALLSFWFGEPEVTTSQKAHNPVKETEICPEAQPSYSIEQALAPLIAYQEQLEAGKKTPLPMRTMAPSITATKIFALVGTDMGPTGPSPGDVLEYTVAITNAGGAMDATGTKFTDTVDPNTTLVPGSVKTSVVAINDAYSTVGNVSISVPSGSGLTLNDVNLDGDVLTVTGVNTAGTQGTVTFAANGSFTFNPNPGFEGSTTFTYTVNDGMFNSTGTVTVMVTGMIWFIQTGATAPGDGRLGSPFSSIANFNSIASDDPNDNIFLYAGAYSSSLTLLNGQNLIGEGAVGTLASLAGVTFSVHPPITGSIPTLGGTNPTIANGALVTTLTVAMNNDVLGITINNTSTTTAFTGNNIGTLKVRNVTLSNAGGTALNLSNGALDAIFTSISASNASHGIRLQTTTGSFEVTGTGTTDGSGGTISTITTRGIEIITASNITLRNMTLNNANTVDAGGDTVCDEDDNTSCNAAIYLSGITGTNLFNNVDITTTQEQGINGINVNNLSMTNCVISGAGAAANVNDIEENAFKFIDLIGTSNFTGCTFQNSFRRNGHIRNSTGNLNLTISNCSFSNTAYDVTRFDCFEMRTFSSATATVNITNSTFHRAGSKGIQCVAEGSSTFNLNISTSSVQRFGNPMAGIEAASANSATMNFNITNNTDIESSGEVAVNTSTAITSDVNGRVNNNTNITNNIAAANTNPNIRVLHEGNGQALVEIKDNTNVASSNIDVPVSVVSRVGTNAAARLDITIDNNNISNTTNTVAGLEGILLTLGQNVVNTAVNTLCANVKNNDLTLPVAYPRAFRARFFDPTSFLNLQGGGTTLATNWTANGNTNNNGGFAQGPTNTFTFSGTCPTPTHSFAPTEEELLAALAANEAPPVVEAAPEVIQEVPVITDEPVVETLSALTVFSGETVTVGGVPGFLLPAGQTMTIVFRVTIDNPFPLNDCSVSNQGTVTGGNFANVLTDDPGVAGAANPTVTNLNIAPTITVCQGNITTGTDPGLCTASESFSSTAVGCGTPTVTYKIGATTITSPHNFPVGTTTVDVTASNGVLPNATCSFTVTVTDTQAPDITCLSGTQMRGTNLGNCTYTVSGSEFNPTVNENCPGFTLTNNFNNTNTLAGAALPTGTTAVVWTITDGALLTDMCTVTIQVTDDDAPTMNCPMNIMVNCTTDIPAPYANLTLFTNAGGTVSDNCGINDASFALINSSGNLQMFTRTYEITDINGLTATCAQTVTVNDVAPPVITPGTIAACYPTVTAAEDAAIAATMAVDGCAGTVTKTASTVGTCTAVITVTATDGANNSASTTYNTRIDNTAPTVTTGTIAACYTSVAAAEAAALAATSATDNCPGALTETASTVGTCMATITVTTSDICGNSATTTYTTSIDNASPTVMTGTIAACYPTVAAAEAAAIAATTAMDDCPSNIVKTASTTGTCSAVVTVTATDACGNSASTTYNTRIDGTPPTPVVGIIAACYPTVAAAEAAALAATTATDNCDGPLTETVSTTGTCSAVVMVTTTDGCGNSAITSYLTRIDNTAPTVTTGTIAACYPTVAAAEAAALAATSATDNCGGALTETASTVGDCSAVITVTTTDGCGNSATTTYNTRIDNTAPTVTTGTIAACYPTVAAAEAAALAATSATDNCTGALTETASTAGTCSAVITVTTTDGCGNSATTTYNTRIDNTAPTVTTGTIAACYPTVAAAEAAALAATSATDNCPGTLTETASTVGTCSAVITVTTTDGCGNSATTTYTTSIDNASPTVTAGTIAACYPTAAAAEAAAIAATTAMDDCPSNIVKTASTAGTCSAVVTVTATDACGNSASTTYNTRIDNTPPTPVVGIIAACYPTVAAAEAAALAATTATDNCDGPLTETASTTGTCSAVVMVTTTDGCGNSATTTYNTRIDNTAPTVTTGTIGACYPTVAAAEAAALAATSATDNCPGALTETASTVGDCSAVITVTTTDGCGNSATTTYNTRIDNTPPTVTTGTIAACYSTLAAAEAAALAATSATDNCSGALTETASTVGTCSAVVTVTTTDGCGNATAVTYNTRIDNTAPTVTTGTIAACYPTVAAAEAAALAATSATDNCPGALTETASTVGTCSAVVTVTTTDGCGNSATTTYNTRIDNAGPTVMTGTIASCYPTVAAAEAAAIAATTANDDCPSSVTKIASTVGTCSAVITVTATDGCGNSATTTYNTRIDNTAPTVIPGTIAACYQTVAAAEAAALAATSATDNCPGALTETASTVGTCSAVITVTTTDGCGNSASVTYNTRIDNTAPTVTTGTIASCYPTVAAAEAAALAATSATDNCPGALTETASTVGTCSAVITVTTTDGCGNSSTTTYNTRIDNTAPSVTTGTIAACYQTVAAAEAAALAATSATDNCPGALTETASTVGTCSAVVTVTTTDGCGNATAVTYNTRIDNTAPTVTVGTLAACYPTAAAAQAAALAATSATDNCPGALTETATVVGTCTAVVTVTTTDGCGNSTQVTYNTRIDNVGPTVTPGTIAACYPTKAAAEAAALAATTIVDDCLSTLTTVVSTTGTCSAVVTITSTDGCGNSASTAYNTRIDNTAPVIVCKNSTVTLTANGAYTLLSSDVLNLGLTSDNCGSYTVTMNPATVTCANKNQTIPVTVTVVDMCGNTSTCTSQITVLEGTALPGGWNNSDVGVANGSSVFSPCTGENGSFVLTSLGFGTSSSDKLHMAYKEICGNTVVTARVTNINGAGWGGVMIRETLMPGSKKVAMKTQLTTNIRRELRTVTNGATTSLNYIRPGHTWLRLERIGSTLNGYSSPNGVTWSFAFTATISMNGCVYVGIFSESINGSTTNTATFDNVTVTGTPNTLAGRPDAQFESESGDHVQIYPNPTTGEVNINLDVHAGKPGTIQVFNALGELMTQERLIPGNLETHNMRIAGAAGVYTVVIQLDDRRIVRRVVVDPNGGK